MNDYPIKQIKKDFQFIEINLGLKGSRTKRIALSQNKELAIFKYERKDYEVSEIASEKMSYEIAKVLNYNCAKIELARDEKNTVGILNYLFINPKIEEHIDILSYLNNKETKRASFYTISNIKKTLNKIDKELFPAFLKIMIFDCLVGEQDRHEENWGIIKRKNIYKISPLYDNGCNLLREFKNIKFAQDFYNKKKDFLSYIKKSKTLIYKEDKKTRYKHFELIEHLYKLYPKEITKEIKNLEKLTDTKIEEIVNHIPKELLTTKHKEYIIIYLKTRKKILINSIGGTKNE